MTRRLQYLHSPRSSKAATFKYQKTFRAKAISSVRSPTAPPIPIKEVHVSPVKALTSVSGVIAQDELPRQVHVRGEPVPVRTILLEDREAKVKVALWRNESGAQTQVGDFVSIQNIVVQNDKGENFLLQEGQPSRNQCMFTYFSVPNVSFSTDTYDCITSK